MEAFHYSDNVLVGRLKYGAEFFAVIFREKESSDPRSLWQVAISRYCVPGRCDTYHFDWSDLGSGYGPRICYFSEGEMPLPKALAMLTKDLDKPAVIDLLSKAIIKQDHFAFSRTLVTQLLAGLAPQGKGVKQVVKIFQRVKAERQQIIAERREKRLAAKVQ